METISTTEFRKRFIAIGLRRAKAGTGSSLATLERRSAVVKVLDLRTVLANVPWAVVGGVATRAYMAERMTLDLDVLVHKRDSATVRRALTNAGFAFVQELLIGGSMWESADKRTLDVLERDDDWVDEAVRDVGEDPQGLPVVKLPYLVLMKLHSSRTQDLADVSRMLGRADDITLTEVLRVAEVHLPESVEDVKSLIQLGKLERNRK